MFDFLYVRPVLCEFSPVSDGKTFESKRNAKGWDLWLLVGQKDDFDETHFFEYHLGSAKTWGLIRKMIYFGGIIQAGKVVNLVRS